MAGQVDRILSEYDAQRDPAGDPGLEALKAAIFVEDVFGITLSDDEITPDVLGSASALRALVTSRLGEP